MRKLAIRIDRVGSDLVVLRIGDSIRILEILPDADPAPEDRAHAGDVQVE